MVRTVLRLCALACLAALCTRGAVRSDYTILGAWCSPVTNNCGNCIATVNQADSGKWLCWVTICDASDAMVMACTAAEKSDSCLQSGTLDNTGSCTNCTYWQCKYVNDARQCNAQSDICGCTYAGGTKMSGDWYGIPVCTGG
jgi:hypothetical protein